MITLTRYPIRATGWGGLLPIPNSIAAHPDLIDTATAGFAAGLRAGALAKNLAVVDGTPPTVAELGPYVVHDDGDTAPARLFPWRDPAGIMRFVTIRVLPGCWS
jgi:hypothetical protein